jgi:leader peptidase (prepilin peptidase)/N-methyltransferase
VNAFDLLFAAFAFSLGAAIGSFLNVCIYRMPRDLSVNNPKRSFCPKCEYQIPWYRNLPLVSWLQLRGRCANCHAPIPFRYFGVELLTALLFLAVWLHVWPSAWVLALPYWVLTGLLVTATFIDFEHFIIPDEITWGGAAVGILLSIAIPALHGETSPLFGGAWALAGAALGYGLLWLVVELGKKAFGKKEFRLAKPTAFSWTRIPGTDPAGGDSDASLVVGDVSEQTAPADRGAAWVWSDLFYRDSDRLVIVAESVEVDGEKLGACTLTFAREVLTVGERTWKLEKTDSITGVASKVVVPREAMGFGDVKFIACIGAFLGWKAVLFTVVFASFLGAIIGLAGIALGRREWSAKIPFGPYLAVGALGWLFFGPQLLSWYIAFALPGPMP